MLPRVSRETEIVSDASPSTSKEMEVKPSIPNFAANQCKSSCDVGIFLTRDAPIDDSVKYQILTKPWTPPPSYSFPTLTSRNLRFQLKWMDRFPFLSYTEVQGGGALCRYCVFFAQSEVGKGKHVKLGKLVAKPFSNWKNAIESFNEHVGHEFHLAATTRAQNFISVFENKKKDIFESLDSGRKAQALQNRAKLNPIVKTVIFCGRQGIPLRGHSDTGTLALPDGDPGVNNGNFRALLSFRIDAGDLALKEHLESCMRNATYISPKIQNEIVATCGDIIVEGITNRITQSGFFSVLADETTDVAGMAQLSLCIRYVDNVEKEGYRVREDFIGFAPVKDKTGPGIKAAIIKGLQQAHLDLGNLRGQGYDGASAMKGHLGGCAALISKDYPLAIYVHCASHSLNLVLSDACKVDAIRNTIGSMKEIITFIRASEKRMDTLKEQVTRVEPASRRTRLVKLSETRWVERHDAISFFKEMFVPIYDTLGVIMGWDDADVSSKAFLMQSAMEKSCFIPGLCCVSRVFGLTASLSATLQSHNFDLAQCIEHVDRVFNEAKAMRNDAVSGFSSLFVEAQEMATSIGCEIRAPRQCGRQVNRDSYGTSDPQTYYRLSAYIPFLDFLIHELQDRFLKHRRVLCSFNALLPHRIVEERTDAGSICSTLLDTYPEDFSTASVDTFKAELQMWKRFWEEKRQEERPHSFIESLNFCCALIFPSVFTAIKIAACMPVTVVPVERSFSTLKRLKTYLRNTMGEERLNGLALMNVHRSIPLDIDGVLDRMSKKNRRLDFVL